MSFSVKIPDDGRWEPLMKQYDEFAEKLKQDYKQNHRRFIPFEWKKWIEHQYVLTVLDRELAELGEE